MLICIYVIYTHSNTINISYLHNFFINAIGWLIALFMTLSPTSGRYVFHGFPLGTSVKDISRLTLLYNA